MSGWSRFRCPAAGASVVGRLSTEAIRLRRAKLGESGKSAPAGIRSCLIVLAGPTPISIESPFAEIA